MSYDVYPLRSRGEKLPVEEVRKRVRRGYIEMARRDDGAPVMVAVLRSERGSTAGELHCASVSKITREGIMVVGWEMPGRHRQAWWCVPALG